MDRRAACVHWLLARPRIQYSWHKPVFHPGSPPSPLGKGGSKNPPSVPPLRKGGKPETRKPLLSQKRGWGGFSERAGKAQGPAPTRGTPPGAFPHPLGCNSVAPGVNPGAGWRALTPSAGKAQGPAPTRGTPPGAFPHPLECNSVAPSVNPGAGWRALLPSAGQAQGPAPTRGTPPGAFPHPLGCNSVAPGVNPGSWWRKSPPGPPFEKGGKLETRKPLLSQRRGWGGFSERAGKAPWPNLKRPSLKPPSSLRWSHGLPNPP